MTFLSEHFQYNMKSGYLHSIKIMITKLTGAKKTPPVVHVISFRKLYGTVEEQRLR